MVPGGFLVGSWWVPGGFLVGFNKTKIFVSLNHGCQNENGFFELGFLEGKIQQGFRLCQTKIKVYCRFIYSTRLQPLTHVLLVRR